MIVRAAVLGVCVLACTAGHSVERVPVTRCPGPWSKPSPLIDKDGNEYLLTPTSAVQLGDGSAVLFGTPVSSYGPGSSELRLRPDLVGLRLGARGGIEPVHVPSGVGRVLSPRAVVSGPSTIDVVWGEPIRDTSFSPYAERLVHARMERGEWVSAERIDSAARLGWSWQSSGAVGVVHDSLYVIDIARAPLGNYSLRVLIRTSGMWHRRVVRLATMTGSSSAVLVPGRGLQVILIGAQGDREHRRDQNSVFLISTSLANPTGGPLVRLRAGWDGGGDYPRTAMLPRSETAVFAWAQGEELGGPATTLVVTRARGDSARQSVSLPLESSPLGLLEPVPLPDGVLLAAGFLDGHAQSWLVRDSTIERCELPDRDIRLGVFIGRLGDRLIYTTVGERIDANRRPHDRTVFQWSEIEGHAASP